MKKKRTKSQNKMNALNQQKFQEIENCKNYNHYKSTLEKSSSLNTSQNINEIRNAIEKNQKELKENMYEDQEKQLNEFTEQSYIDTIADLANDNEKQLKCTVSKQDSVNFDQKIKSIVLTTLQMIQSFGNDQARY